MGDALRSTGQRVAKVYSVDGEMSYAVHPDPGPEFKPTDLEDALQNGHYQHVHLLTHGAPDGFYWEQAAVRRHAARLRQIPPDWREYPDNFRL